MKESSEYLEDDWLALSGIQHFSFCRRQWALIHIEQVWSENYLTTAGNLQHERVHDYSQSEQRGDLLILRDLRVFSRTLGVSGDCDAVEFHRSDDGIPLQGRDGKWTAYPVEYKHGRPKTDEADRLQLCAEAMCLEEMLSCDIPQGALFYQEIKHREKVELNEKLRLHVRSAFAEMHRLFERGYTPKVRPTKACKSCSLKELCVPELSKVQSVQNYMRSMLDINDGEHV